MTGMVPVIDSPSSPVFFDLTPWQWANLVAAIVSTCAAWWVISRADWIINRVFPYNEWEKSLGWLNIRAQKRADAGLRWLGYFVYAMLAIALLGIPWAAEGLRTMGPWYEPDVLSGFLLRLGVLVLCFGLWFFYFGCGLLPRLRREREQKEWKDLQKFRAAHTEAERARPVESRSRVHKPPQKPRVNSPFDYIAPDRDRKRR